MLNLKKFKFGYPKGPYFNANLHLEEGKILLIIGPNGTGKSSLIQAITGILPTLGGAMLWKDQDWTQLPLKQRSLSLMCQGHNLFPGLSAYKNLLCVPGVKGPMISPYIDEFDLASVLHSVPAQMSGGQEQAFAFIRCFLHNQPLWLLDEPISALAKPLAAQFMQKLQAHTKAHNNTVIIISHQESCITPYVDDCRDIGSIVECINDHS